MLVTFHKVEVSFHLLNSTNSFKAGNEGFTVRAHVVMSDINFNNFTSSTGKLKDTVYMMAIHEFHVLVQQTEMNVLYMIL